MDDKLMLALVALVKREPSGIVVIQEDELEAIASSGLQVIAQAIGSDNSLMGIQIQVVAPEPVDRSQPVN